jgi:pimeloyl-ACP methyl ester carboxylesterase
MGPRRCFGLATISALGTAAALCLLGCSKSEVDGATIIHTTADGMDLSGTYHQPDSSARQPTLLLLHQTGPTHNRHDFDAIWLTLSQAGFGLVAPDLRSHGFSDPGGELDDLAYDPQGYPEDVRGWLQFISDRAEAGDPLDRERVGIIGLGTSASLAAAALGKGYVSCAVALSPSINEINALEGGFPRSGEVPGEGGGAPDPDLPVVLTDTVALHSTLWMVSVGDEPAATDGPVLHEASAEPSELHEETGSFHGEELLLISEDNQRTMADWCLGIL